MTWHPFAPRRRAATGLASALLLLSACTSNPEPNLPPPLATPVTTPEPTPVVSALQAGLTTTAFQHSGNIGLVVKHLETGETATLNAQKRFRSAGLYKVFVLYTAYQDLESGALSRDEVLTLSQQTFDQNPTSEWLPGTRTTARCALEAMTTLSVNAAADMLVDRLGGPGRITAEMSALGLTQSELTYQRAYSSPADIAQLLELIARREAVSSAASEEMLQLLLAQKRDDRLPFPLPAEVPVAHKTGELRQIRNDAGIVYAPSGPYLFVALVSEAPSDAEARATVVDLSREAYTLLEPSGLSQSYGLPPRLAEEVFRVPDAQGRLAPMANDWAKTVSVRRMGLDVTKQGTEVTLRQEVIPDLEALQHAAAVAGTPFWVAGGYRAPTRAEVPKMLRKAPDLSCAVEFPPRPTPVKSAPAVVEAPVATPTPEPEASEEWLGTVVTVSDVSSGDSSAGRYPASPVGSWLLAHAWDYGFVPAPSDPAARRTPADEPWKLRWVGREMAARLRTVTHEGSYSLIRAELGKTQHELTASGHVVSNEFPLPRS